MKVWVAKILGFLGNRLPILGKILLQIRDKIVFAIIKPLYRKAQIQIQNYDEKICEKIIWIYWAQGIDTAPDLVKVCYNRLKAFNKEYKVVLIDNNNISEYISIPEYIYQKVEKKKITLTHFSDIIRIHLLAEYGGIWMDSTVFIGESFSDFINNERKLITIPQDNISYNISKGKWSAWMIGTKKKCRYFQVCATFFDLYWEKYNMLACYFLIDYLLEYTYRNDYEFRKDVDEVLKLDYSVYELMEIRNSKCSIEDYNKFLSNNIINKMSYKEKFDKDIIGTYSYYMFTQKEI
jgi:hypothetical protein